MIELKIDEDLRSLIPPLAQSEFELLEQSILAEGCRDPLVVWNGVILDGHHRYGICTKHNVPFKTKEMQFDSKEDAKIWIIRNQLGRRNLPEWVQFELVQKEKEILLEIGRRKQLQSLKQYQDTVLSTVDKTVGEPHNTREEIADKLGWSTGKVAMAEVVQKEAPPHIIEKLRNNEITINKAYGKVREQKRKEEIEAAVQEMQSVPHSDKYKIIVGDMATVQLDECFDFIITDPPYPKEYLPLYEVLAKRSQEWLKDDGLLVVMCGQSYLDKILQMITKHISYYWTCAYLTPGQPTPLRQRQVNTSWKPILIFGRDEYKGKIFGDVFRSNSEDKSLHEWQQSLSGMESIVKQLCVPGQHILDPFCGTGTTGIAALKHNCFFTGIEIDEETTKIAIGRLGELK